MKAKKRFNFFVDDLKFSLSSLTTGILFLILNMNRVDIGLQNLYIQYLKSYEFTFRTSFLHWRVKTKSSLTIT